MKRPIRVIKMPPDVPLPPPPSPRKSVIGAVLCMLLSFSLLWGLDIMADKPKPAPEPLSKQLEVRRQWAAAELSYRLKERTALQDRAVELNRQTAEVWLEFANSKRHSDGKKNSNEKESVLTEGERDKKLNALGAARRQIEELLKQSDPKLEQLATIVDQSQTMPAIDAGAGLWARLADDKSALNYIYRAVVIGLVGVFSACGLYLLYLAARKMNIVPDLGDKFDGLFKAAAESSKAPAALLGTAVLTGVVTAGGVVAASSYGRDDGAVAKSEIVHHYYPQPPGKPGVPSVTSNVQNNTENNFVDNSGQTPSPLKVSLQEPLPPVSATLEAGATWASSVVQLERATGNLSSEADKLLLVSKQFTSAAELFKSGLQNIRVVLPETADKPLRRLVDEDYVNTQASLKQLMKSNVIVDCKFQHALAAIYSVGVHTSRAAALDGSVTIDPPCPLK